MAIEIEAKMRVEDFDALIGHLKQQGGRRLGKVLETNIFFDTPSRELLAGDQGLRVRTSEDVVSGNKQIVVTHKGPRQQGELKSRQETELIVHDEQTAVQLLEALGFVRAMRFAKKRESWQLDGCRIELDELPYLGRFVEIEGPNDVEVLQIRQKLGLQQAELIKASYSQLLTKYLHDHGLASQDVRFE